MFLASWPKRFNTWAGIVGAASEHASYQFTSTSQRSSHSINQSIKSLMSPEMQLA